MGGKITWKTMFAVHISSWFTATVSCLSKHTINGSSKSNPLKR